VRKFNPKTEQDYPVCLRMLLEYGANLAADPKARLRASKKRPTPVFQAVRSELMLKSAMEYIKRKPELLE